MLILLCLLNVVFISLLAYGFGLLDRGWICDFLVLLGLFLIVGLPTVTCNLCERRIRLIGLWFWLCICVGLVISFKDICLCAFNQQYQLFYFDI